MQRKKEEWDSAREKAKGKAGGNKIRELLREHRIREDLIKAITER